MGKAFDRRLLSSLQHNTFRQEESVQCCNAVPHPLLSRTGPAGRRNDLSLWFVVLYSGFKKNGCQSDVFSNQHSSIDTALEASR